MAGAHKQAPSAVEIAVLTSLREAMGQQGRQQTEVAAAVGISASQLSRILAGKRPASFTEVVHLARALDVDLVGVVARAETTAGSSELGVGEVPAKAQVDMLILRADMEQEKADNHTAGCG